MTLPKVFVEGVGDGLWEGGYVALDGQKVTVAFGADYAHVAAVVIVEAVKRLPELRDEIGVERRIADALLAAQGRS